MPGTWKWGDGTTPLNYHTWIDGQPNEAGEIYGSLSINPMGAIGLADETELEMKSIICEQKIGG